MADNIEILGIELRCRVGVPDWERRRPQLIRADIVLETDLRKAGRSDELADAVDYQALERRVRRAAQGGSTRLLERLAEILAREALGCDRRIRAVTVRLSKKPVLMTRVASVRVEICRARRA